MTRRRTRAQLTTHVSAELAAEIGRLAASQGASVSAMVEVLLAEALRADVEHQHAALLETAVQRAVSRAMDRIADLAFRAALDSDETRRLVMALLINAAGTERARALRREAHSAAWQRLREPVPAPPEADGVCQAPPTRS
jgi:hypothetical protein